MNDVVINEIFKWIGYFLSIVSVIQVIYSFMKNKDYNFPLNNHSLKRAKLQAEKFLILGEYKKSAAIYENIFNNFPDSINNFINYVKTTTKYFINSFFMKYNEIDFTLLDEQFNETKNSTFIEYLKIKFFLKNKYDQFFKKELVLIIPYGIILFFSLFISIFSVLTIFSNVIFIYKILIFSPIIIFSLKLFLEQINKSKIIKIINHVMFSLIGLFIIIILIPIIFSFDSNDSLFEVFRLFDLVFLFVPFYCCINISFFLKKQFKKELPINGENIVIKFIINAILSLAIYYVLYFIFRNNDNVYIICSYTSILIPFLINFIISFCLVIKELFNQEQKNTEKIFNLEATNALIKGCSSFVRTSDINYSINFTEREKLFYSIKELLIDEPFVDDVKMIDPEVVYFSLNNTSSNDISFMKLKKTYILQDCESIGLVSLKTAELLVHPKNKNYKIEKGCLYYNEKIIGRFHANEDTSFWQIDTN